jgi:hypothetical protein
MSGFLHMNFFVTVRDQARGRNRGSIMGRAGCCWILIVVSSSPVFSADSEPRWQVYAGCAAAYQANWQNRLSDPSRKPEMSTMIRDESEQYKLAAVGYYEKDNKASKDEANRGVEVYVGTSIERFIAMDKAGTLETFIDKCPQREQEN